MIWLTGLGIVTFAGFLALSYFGGFLSGERRTFTIPASSMEPTLRIGDYVFADLAAYAGKEPERGDVVAFRPTGQPDVDYVKRIVGLPGETIQLIAGVLHINGTPVRRDPAGSYRPSGHPDAPPLPRLSTLHETLPNGRRYTVIASQPKAVGADTVRFSVPAGHYFVLGDYRDNSLDSRFTIGFVQRGNIRGKFTRIYWARDLSRIFSSVHDPASPVKSP
jgi:signal peptidase I